MLATFSVEILHKIFDPHDMKHALLVIAVLLNFISLVAQSQSTVVSGKVLDDGNSAVPGVNIILKGTTQGVVTNASGEFSISIETSQAKDAVLVFSFIGFKTVEVPVGDRTSLTVILSPDVTSLDEVVVVGYGEQKKTDVSGSVVSVSPRDLNKGVLASPQDMLVGKIAGVQVSTNDGAPGAGATIRIRGTGSILGNQDPLIVIDGFPIDASKIGGISNVLATINPNDIESYTVLKDASATAIYGLRASNGVIIITTKRGKEGKMQVGYSGNVSVSSPMKFVSVLNGNEMRSMVTDLVNAGTVPGLNATAAEKLGTENTNWQSEIFHTAVSHDHNVSVSGATKLTPYRVSYGYTDQQGILRTTGFKRHSVNLNVSPEFLDGDLKVSVTAKGSYTESNFGNTGAVGSAVAFDPTQPVRNGSSRWGGFFAWVGPPSATFLDPNGDPIGLATANPVALLEQTRNIGKVYRLLGNAQVDYRLRFFPDIKLTVNAGLDYATTDGINNAPTNSAFTYASGQGQLINYTGKNVSRLLDVYANYKKAIGKHVFDATAGYSYQSFQRDGSVFSRNGFSTIFSDFQYNQEGKEVPRQYVGNPNYLLSFFGRLNYTFKEKYMATVSFRNDASSRFSKNNRWIVFPAVGLSWLVNKESFLADSKVISELKLRGSYGITGQQEISSNPYPYLATYQLSSSTSMYQFGNTYYNTYRPQPYDANIKWETTTQVDVGLDFGLFKNRISGVIDVYRRDTRNLLNTVPVPAGSNFSNALVTNIGSMVNEGIEVTLNGVVAKNDNLEWRVGSNLTVNRNHVTKLTRYNNADYLGEFVGGIGLQRYIQNIQVGYPINSFFVYQQVYNTAGQPLEGIYVNRSGGTVEVASVDKNKYRLHSPQALFLLGLNTQVRYKQFDLYMSGRLSVGNYVYNAVAASAVYSNLYFPAGYFNNLPRYIQDTKFVNQQPFSDYYIQDASFFKMDNISLGYNPNLAFSSRLKARISLTVQNAFFITRYKGIDPEVVGGIDNNIYPRARVFTLGVNLTY